MQVSGLKLQDEATVRHLAGFGPGTPLTETRLADYQERLQKAGLYGSASVSFEPDPALAAATPVRVRLTELPLQQATVGVGVSGNTGPRATLEHTHRRPFDWPVVAYNKLEWGRDTQSYTGDFQTHPTEGFYRNLLGVQVERVISDTDVVLSQRLRLGRTQDTKRFERLYFAELLRSRQQVFDSATVASASAVSANVHLVWRQLDSVLLPTRGFSLSLQGAAGQAVSRTAQDGPFGRLYGRITGYLPLGRQWYGQARLEAGQILKRTGIEVPDALGFRAGGDDSVRGYPYRTLAPLDNAGNTVSGDALLTASLELARPISAQLALGVGCGVHRRGPGGGPLGRLPPRLWLRRGGALAQPHRPAAHGPGLGRRAAQGTPAPVGGHRLLTPPHAMDTPPTPAPPAGPAAGAAPATAQPEVPVVRPLARRRW